jgi:hypothetical protein
MLGYDTHGPLLPLLPQVLGRSVAEPARLQALRFAPLVPMLLGTLRALFADRTESTAIRGAAMASLLVLDRAAFTLDARAILQNPDEDQQVLETARTGLRLVA